MKMNKKMIRPMILVLVVAMVCCGCAKTQPVPNGSVANDPGTSSSLMLSHAVLELSLDGAVGHLYPLHAEENAALEWFVEDNSVVEVSGGRITPMTEGTTVVTCTDGSNTASCTVIVRDVDVADYELKFSVNALSAKMGTSGEVEYTYTGPGAVAVFSSDPSVLRVENGRWEAIATGTAFITCTDGMKHTQCCITITEIGPES